MLFREGDEVMSACYYRRGEAFVVQKILTFLEGQHPVRVYPPGDIDDQEDFNHSELVLHTRDE